MTTRQKTVPAHRHACRPDSPCCRSDHPAYLETDADLFAGGGGTSLGLVRDLRERGLVLGKTARLIAINHDRDAIETHRRNHPDAEHYEDDVESIDPKHILRGTRLQLLVGSPPCQHFSRAAGGKPKNRQLRATVLYVVKWMRWGRPRRVVLENVTEFLDSPEYKKLLHAVRRLRRLGLNYVHEHRTLNAADYGEAQQRKRAFVQFALDGDPISWPDATHAEPRRPSRGKRPWRGAIEILELDHPTRSIFDRPKPHSDKTRARLARGIREQWGAFWEPLAKAVETWSGPVPLAKLLESSPPDAWPSFFRVRCFTIGAGGPARQGEPSSAERPLRSLTTDPHLALCDAAFILGQQGGAVARGTGEALPVIPAAGYLRLAGAEFVLPPLGKHARGGEANKPRSTADPLNTILAEKTSAHVAEARLEVRPFLVPQHGERPGQAPRIHDANEPLPTIPTSALPRLAGLLIVTYNGQEKTARDANDPLGTVTGADRLALAEVLVANLHRPETNRGLAHGGNMPLPAITGSPQLAAVEAACEVRAEDIYVHATLRMLTTLELARGQGFPDTYEFTGTKRSKTRQIGNAVPVNLSYHLMRAARPTRGRLDLQE